MSGVDTEVKTALHCSNALLHCTAHCAMWLDISVPQEGGVLYSEPVRWLCGAVQCKGVGAVRCKGAGGRDPNQTPRITVVLLRAPSSVRQNHL
jgi:hypothetical protein